MVKKNNLSEIELLERGIKGIDDAVNSLVSIPDEIWNGCINSDYIWSQDLVIAYKNIKSVKDRIHSYLDFLSNLDESKKSE